MNEQTQKSQRDKENLEKMATATLRRSARELIIAVPKAYARNTSLGIAISQSLKSVEGVFYDGMVAAHLTGRLRSVIAATRKIKERKAFGPYDEAVGFMQNRLKLKPTELARLKAIYGDTATAVTRNLGTVVESNAKLAADTIITEGMHVREGTVYLREALRSGGLDSPHPWLLETLVRTQIALAYSAGRWNGNQDPVISNVLWGYDYVTAGDDRVRPTHEAMDGASYPKEHPFWSENWPPNGFNCRCDTIEIFKDEKPKTKAVAEVEVVDGIEVIPGADVDWRYNSGVVFNDMSGTVIGR